MSQRADNMALPCPAAARRNPPAAVGRRSFALLLLAAVTIVMLSGCSTYLTVGPLPQGAEFQQSAAALKRQYPAFAEFAPSMRRYLLATIQARPPAGEIFSAWGQPDDKGMFWWWWEFPLVVNRPYYWDRSGKRVTAIISRPLFIGFRPRIFSLDVEPLAVSSRDTTTSATEKSP